MTTLPAAALTDTADTGTVAMLEALEARLRWLSAWTIHHANHLRDSPDGLKVGGHQASCASITAIMTVLYFHALGPHDKVAVKPHAGPVLHAIHYLLGTQSRDALERFRGFGGAQSYPSRTKDTIPVDFSTGSVGLGVAVTLFASLVQDYLVAHGGLAPADTGRMIALMGDAELDEGNIYEALIEGYKHDVRNCWWVVDYNRQSLDHTTADRMFRRFDDIFETCGWRVLTLKYGKKQQAAFARPGGIALRDWIDACPNVDFAALTYQGGAAWRARLLSDIGGRPNVAKLLAGYDDEALADVMTNLGGHCIATLIDAFASAQDDRPTLFIAYTVKGYGLPFAGHKDNHAGLMNPGQIAALRERLGIAAGDEWAPWAGLGDNAATAMRAFVEGSPIGRNTFPVPSGEGRETRGARPGGGAVRARPSEMVGEKANSAAPSFPTPDPSPEGEGRHLTTAAIPVPRLPVPDGAEQSTQAAFGRILLDLAKSTDPQAKALADRIVTTSPDVTVSTNLGAFVNARGLFRRSELADVFHAAKIPSPQKWRGSGAGQHLELGIAENNLFLALAAFGLAAPLCGTRLIPIGTVYDPFIARGLDALNYGCYQDARFLLVATPSGLTLGPEGGAHQSINSPLIGIGQPGLTYYEPAFADELALLMGHAFRHLQAADGGSVYLRLTTRVIAQVGRTDASWEAGAVAGGYWLRAPAPGASVALVVAGAIMPEVLAAYDALIDDLPGLGVLAVTSPDLLHRGWTAAQATRWTGRGTGGGAGGVLGRGSGSEANRGDGSAGRSHVDDLLAVLAPDAGLVTVIDGSPSALSWLGGVRGHRVAALGVDRFGQTGTLPDLYRAYRLDADAVIDAVAELLHPRG